MSRAPVIAAASPTRAARPFLDAAARIERLGLLAVELEARAYAAHTHGNLNGAAYRAREEARDRLLDALAALDAARGHP